MPARFAPEAAWLAAVLASLLAAPETRAAAVAVAALCAAAWALAWAVLTGRVPLPASVSARARRPLSTRSLLLLGAAVGPSISFFVLACLRVLALSPEERRRVIA